jgi:hypothetical protein
VLPVVAILDQPFNPTGKGLKMGTTKWAVVSTKTVRLWKASAFFTLLVLGGCQATTGNDILLSDLQPDHCDANYCNVGKKPKP